MVASLSIWEQMDKFGCPETLSRHGVSERDGTPAATVQCNLRILKEDRPLVKAINQRLKDDREFARKLLAFVEECGRCAVGADPELDERVKKLEEEVASIKKAIRFEASNQTDEPSPVVGGDVADLGDVPDLSDDADVKENDDIWDHFDDDEDWVNVDVDPDDDRLEGDDDRSEERRDVQGEATDLLPKGDAASEGGADQSDELEPSDDDDEATDDAEDDDAEDDDAEDDDAEDKDPEDDEADSGGRQPEPQSF